MYILSMIILVFFAIIGLCSFVSVILDKFYQNGGNAELTLKNLTAADAEARIRSAARVCQHHRGFRLICVCDEDDPAYDICRLMQKEYPFMEIASKQQMRE